MSYTQSFILTHTLTYYTSGPKFQCIEKSLLHNDLCILDSFRACIRSSMEKTKKQHPELFGTSPYQNEAWNIPVALEITTIELALVIQAFDEAMKETEGDNFYELEVIAGYPITDIRRCFELLLTLNKE